MYRPKIFIFQSLPSKELQHQFSSFLSRSGIKTLLLDDSQPPWYVSMLQTLGVHPVLLSLDCCPQLSKSTEVEIIDTNNWSSIKKTLEEHL